MPASKKTLRNQQQKTNKAAGIGDEKGRIASSQKADKVMVACSICKQEIRMIKKNEQAKQHVDTKHPKETFDKCFPGYTCE